MMAEIAPGRVRTFNISFREEEFNESPFAKAVSGQFATDHQELTVVPDHAGIIPKLVWHYSEPYADPSAIPSYYLSRLSREFVTVALSGDGGDELFGGYPRYLFDQPGARERSTNSILVRAAQRIPMNMRGFWRIRKWFEEKCLNVPEIYFQKISFFNETEKKQLYSAAFLEATQNANTLQWLSKRMQPFQKLEFPQNLMAFDTHTYLPDDLLVKQDIASMACSLEVRAPLLDQQIMEFAASLPVSLKIRNGTTKYLLRAYLRGKVPESLIQRPKMGFGVPLKSWFRNELRSMTEDVLLSQAATQRGYFRKSVIEKLINRHGSGLFDHSYQLYALLVLEIWHLLFIDNRKESLAQGRFTV
jgi:asparagine synthase (glutamine-hydrolysing)